MSSRPNLPISSDLTFHVLSVRHMMHKCIPSKYNCTPVRYHVNAQELLHITQHKTSRKISVAYQYTALLFQIAACRLWRQTPLIKAVFHPASYTCTADHSLSGVLAKLNVYTLHIQITRFSDCICVRTNLTVEAVCRVGEHQLHLAHQCSPYEQFVHT